MDQGTCTAGRRRTLRWALAAAILLAAAPASYVAAAHAAGTASDKHVLLLLPSDTAFPWVAQLSSALRLGLEQGERSVFVFTEDIDVERFPDDQYAERLRGWLAEKYARTQFDLIVAPGPQVLGFLGAYAPEAWRAVPVITVTDPRVGAPPALPGGVTGFLTRLDLHATIADAVALRPGTRRVAVVSGTSAPERSRTRALLAEVGTVPGVEVYDLGRLRLQELLAQVSRLPEDTVVMFVSFRVDADGRAYLPERVMGELARASARPVFTLYEPLVGRGAVGGRVISFAAIGEALAALGSRVLDGTRVQDVAWVDAGFSRPVYDARELERHRLDAGLLPAGAELRHREESLLDRYRWAVFAIAAALLLQAALIGALLVERERRRRAESRARRSLGQLAHLDRVAAMGELATSFAHELNQPLAAILANAQAARRLLGAPAPDLAEVRASLDDIVADDKRAGEVIRRLRSLLKKEEFRPEPVDLNEVVRVVLRLLAQDAARRGVSVETDLAPNLPPVRGDTVQLQQIVLNLAVNAFDAVARCAPDRRHVTLRSRERPSGALELLVQDAGEGIPESHLAQLFQPFFTTKADGLGMGLSIARSILELHGGEISAWNAPGGGACFCCVLPPHGRREANAARQARAA